MTTNQNPSPASPPPPSFRFLGQELRVLPVTEVVGHAILFGLFMALLMACGAKSSPGGIATGFMVICAMRAGVSVFSWRGFATLALVFFASGALFRALS